MIKGLLKRKRCLSDRYFSRLFSALSGKKQDKGIRLYKMCGEDRGAPKQKQRSWMAVLFLNPLPEKKVLI